MYWQLILNLLLKNVAILGQINEKTTTLLPWKRNRSLFRYLHLGICDWMLLSYAQRERERENTHVSAVGKYLKALLNLFSRKLIFSTGILKSKQSFPGVSPTQLVVLNHGHFILNYLKGQFALSLQMKYIYFSLCLYQSKWPPYWVTSWHTSPPNSDHIPAQTFQLLHVFTPTSPAAAA